MFFKLKAIHEAKNYHSYYYSCLSKTWPNTLTSDSNIFNSTLTYVCKLCSNFWLWEVGWHGNCMPVYYGLLITYLTFFNIPHHYLFVFKNIIQMNLIRQFLLDDKTHLWDIYTKSPKLTLKSKSTLIWNIHSDQYYILLSLSFIFQELEALASYIILITETKYVLCSYNEQTLGPTLSDSQSSAFEI